MVVVLVALASSGCAWLAVNTGLPGLSSRAQIEILAERMDYIDAMVSVGGSTWRLFFPRNEICRLVLKADDVTFRLSGNIGTAAANDESCVAVGILSLREWRDRRGRASRETARVVPNDRVQYTVIYTDDDVFFARGRFRLASLVNWPGGLDTIAVFPNDEACAGVRAKTVGMMEFRTSGPVPLSIFDGQVRCPVLGFAMPQPQAQREPDVEAPPSF